MDFIEFIQTKILLHRKKYSDGEVLDLMTKCWDYASELDNMHDTSVHLNRVKKFMDIHNHKSNNTQIHYLTILYKYFSYRLKLDSQR